MARKPNYRFERLERQRQKAAKKAARIEAKRKKSEDRKLASTLSPEDPSEVTSSSE